MRDPHQVLGVAKGADAETVKRAYRRLAKQFHPDTAGGDRRAESKFQEITEAYRALRALANAEERIAASAAEATRAYEHPRPEMDTEEPPKKGRARNASSPKPERPPPGRHEAAAESAPIDDSMSGDKSSGRGFFENIKRAGFKPFERRGDDLACTLPLPFLDAARGGTHRVNLPTGRTVDVTLPAGIEDGKQVRLRGLGAAGSAGGSAGDALVTVDIEPHPYFSREGHDIHLALPISIAEAIDGAKVQVPTVWGRVWVTIPAGSNSGTVLRLSGKGLKKPDGEMGNQLIELIVMLPDTPDAELQAFVRRWPGAKSHDPRAAFGLS